MCSFLIISFFNFKSVTRLMNVLVCVLFQLMCTVDDLKEMGIPLGPRKKIANFVKHKAAKLVKLISPPRKQSSSVTSLGFESFHEYPHE